METMYIPSIARILIRGLSSRIWKARYGLEPLILGHFAKIKAKRDPQRPILVFERENRPDEIVTYSNLYFQANKIAYELKRMGLKQGDRFAVYMRNHPEVVYCLVAASITGMLAVLIDPRNRGEILRHILTDSKAKLIIFADYLLEDVKEVLGSIGIKNALVLNSKDEGDFPTTDFDSLEEVLKMPDKEYVEHYITDPNHPFQIIYTSGTTGMPKGVTQPNIRFFLTSMLSYFFGYKKSDILYTGLSLSHGNAQAVTVFPAIVRGIKAVISRKFTKSRLWKITKDYRVTTFSLLGGMTSGIYNEPPKPDNCDNTVRMVVSAGTPYTIFEAFEKRFNVKILEWYGTVEGGFTCKPIDKGPIGSFGKHSIPFLIDFRVVDENDNDCLPGVKGELISRMRLGETKVEYFGKPDASSQKTQGGWLRSGDMCHMDENGWLYFDFRKGEGLRHQGDFISVDMLEKVIGEIEDISDVYIYGVPAASGAPGESDLVAAVSPIHEKTIDPQKIFKNCRDRLPSHFVPTYVQLLSEIPKTPSEKPKAHLLKSTFSTSMTNVFTEKVPKK